MSTVYQSQNEDMPMKRTRKLFNFDETTAEKRVDCYINRLNTKTTATVYSDIYIQLRSISPLLTDLWHVCHV